MSAFRRWLVKAAEKFAERYHEGPEPPERLKEMVIVFANLHPRATREEWAAFASNHAAEAYRSGYARGREWAEREEYRDPEIDPEVIADAHDPNWRWQPGAVLQGDGRLRVLSAEEAEAIEPIDDQLRRLGGMTKVRGGRR